MPGPGPRRVAVLLGSAGVGDVGAVRRRLDVLLRGATPDRVVAADGGGALALALGVQPDLVVGDFDSLDPATLADLRGRGVRIDTHPRDKDATDGHLAVQHALAAGATDLLMVGFLRGRRLDHEIANLLLLATLPAHVRGTLLDAANTCTLLRGGQQIEWPTEAGEIVSLIPLADHAVGVSTEGLRWQLRDAVLRLGDTRGVSNEPDPDARHGSAARVSLVGGRLLVCRYLGDAVPRS